MFGENIIKASFNFSEHIDDLIYEEFLSALLLCLVILLMVVSIIYLLLILVSVAYTKMLIKFFQFILK